MLPGKADVITGTDFLSPHGANLAVQMCIRDRYWTSPEQEAVVRRMFDIEAAALDCFEVESGPLLSFYPAEEPHQRYLEKHPGGYCHISLSKISALSQCPVPVYDRPAKVILREYLERTQRADR